MLALSIILAVSTAALPVPEPGTTPPNPVDFDVIQGLALRKAGAEWPEAVPGPAVPYLDPSGATIAWMFHFTTDGRVWPGFEQAAADVRAEAKAILEWWGTPDGGVIPAEYPRIPVGAPEENVHAACAAFREFGMEYCGRAHTSSKLFDEGGR